MTTATGDFAINFVPLGDVNPYTNASLTYIGSERFQILSNVLKPVTGQGPLARYNGSMTAGATIRAKVEVGNAAAGGDQILCVIVDTSYNGYALRVNATDVSLSLLTAGAISGLVSGTASTAVSGTVFELERVHATNTLNCNCNGSLISGMSQVDATFTTGLSFGIAMYPDNSNASTVLSFAGDGIAVSSSARSLLLLGVG